MRKDLTQEILISKKYRITSFFVLTIQDIMFIKNKEKTLATLFSYICLVLSLFKIKISQNYDI
jgi:hypothetical protein